jgi:hypothetical protein
MKKNNIVKVAGYFVPNFWQHLGCVAIINRLDPSAVTAIPSY